MSEMEKVIGFLQETAEYFRECRSASKTENHFWELQNAANEAVELLKEQKKQKLFVDSDGKITPLPDVVRCKDCRFKECEGRNGLIVCDITGDSHKPDFFCADGEREE